MKKLLCLLAVLLVALSAGCAKKEDAAETGSEATVNSVPTAAPCAN